MLSEMLATSPIIRGANAGPDTGSFVDDNIDPEFAEAIRLSLAQEQPKAEGTPSSVAPITPTGGFADDPELAEAIRISLVDSTNSANSNSNSSQPSVAEVGEMEEDDELARAIALSCETASADRANDEKVKVEKEKERDKLCKSSDMQVELPNKPDESAQELDVSKVDPDFMSSLLLELPGIDPNDPDVQELLKGMKADDEKKDTTKK